MCTTKWQSFNWNDEKGIQRAMRKGPTRVPGHTDGCRNRNAKGAGISAQTTADAHVGDDRTTHEATTFAEAHSALQAGNQKLLEYVQSLQQHVDQLLAALRENDASMLALQHRVDAMNTKDAKTQAEL